jgi:hypothetical protein
MDYLQTSLYNSRLNPIFDASLKPLGVTENRRKTGAAKPEIKY